MTTAYPAGEKKDTDRQKKKKAKIVREK